MLNLRKKVIQIITTSKEMVIDVINPFILVNAAPLTLYVISRRTMDIAPFISPGSRIEEYQ